MEEIRTVLAIGEIKNSSTFGTKELRVNDLLRKYDWEKNRKVLGKIEHNVL